MIFATSQTGDSLTVNKITFTGNHIIKTKTLRQLVTTKPNQSLIEMTLEKDIEYLKTYYTQQGFENASVVTQIRTTAKGKNIEFEIQEGLRTQIERIELQGVKSFSASDIAPVMKLRPGSYLISREIYQQEKAIIQWYKNRGYPYVTIETQIERVGNRVKIIMNVNEGSIAYIKAVYVRGNQKVTDRVILITTEIKAGEKFSLAKLNKARQRLYASQLFERVSYYILETARADTLNIRFDVLELPARSIGFGIGVQTPNTALLLSAEWQHLNLFSRRHTLLLATSYTPSFNGDWQTEIKSSYKINYILSTPIIFTLQPAFRYEQIDSFKQDELNIETGVSRYLGPQFEVGTFLKYLRVWSNYPLTNIAERRSITNSQNLFFRYDARDDLFAPTKGVFLTANLQYAGSIYDGDNDFVKNQTEFVVFTKAVPQIVVGFRALAGITVPYGRTSIVPYFETFSLGGNNGLRGYNDKSIGPTVINEKFHYGEAVVNTNLELRSHFQKLFDFVVFFDMGRVTNRNEFLNFSSDLLNYSTGIGLRVNLPIGPIRLDYARRLKNTIPGDWGKIHLGLLNIF